MRELLLHSMVHATLQTWACAKQRAHWWLRGRRGVMHVPAGSRCCRQPTLEEREFLEEEALQQDRCGSINSRMRLSAWTVQPLERQHRMRAVHAQRQCVHVGMSAAALHAPACCWRCCRLAIKLERLHYDGRR